MFGWDVQDLLRPWNTVVARGPERFSLFGRRAVSKGRVTTSIIFFLPITWPAPPTILRRALGASRLGYWGACSGAAAPLLVKWGWRRSIKATWVRLEAFNFFITLRRCTLTVLSEMPSS